MLFAGFPKILFFAARRMKIPLDAYRQIYRQNQAWRILR